MIPARSLGAGGESSSSAPGREGMGTSRGAGCPRRVSPVPRDGPGTVLAGSEPDGVVQPFPTQPLAELPCEHPEMPPLPAPRPHDSRSLPHPARRPPWHWPQPLCPVPGQLLAHSPQRQDFRTKMSLNPPRLRVLWAAVSLMPGGAPVCRCSSLWHMAT